VQTCSPTTSYSCNGQQIQVTTTGSCSSGSCSGSTVTPGQTCSPTPGPYYCSGNQVRQTTTGLCNSNGSCTGSSEALVQTCGTGQTCSNGACVTTGGTWNYSGDGGEYCPDICGGSFCNGACPTPQCPSSPQGKSCSNLGAMCYSVSGHAAYMYFCQ
jgi:hypothetical protein